MHGLNEYHLLNENVVEKIEMKWEHVNFNFPRSATGMLMKNSGSSFTLAHLKLLPMDILLQFT